MAYRKSGCTSGGEKKQSTLQALAEFDLQI